MGRFMKDTACNFAFSKDQTKKIKFRYDPALCEQVYRFPVYMTNGEPLLFCKLWVDEETDHVFFGVYNTDDTIYASYYDRNYGKSAVVDEIDKRLQAEFQRLGIQNICGGKKHEDG